VVEYIHLYCKVDCPYCKDAISLLEEEKRDFVVTILDHCKPFEDGIKKELNFKTVPIILRCLPDRKVEMIGGYTELRSFIQKEKGIT
jgi:glutaredoxin